VTTLRWRLERCKACGARISIVFSTIGKPVLIDTRPPPDGTGTLILVAGGNGLVVALVARPGDAESEPRYRPHSATCNASKRKATEART
jgi:hypothetical protein